MDDALLHISDHDPKIEEYDQTTIEGNYDQKVAENDDGKIEDDHDGKFGDN